MTTAGHAHVTPPRVYFVVYILLVVLLAATVGVYYMHLGAILSIGVAMFIALIKALLVVLYFMQVKYGTRLTWLWAALGFVWLLLMTGILVDYQTRHLRATMDSPPFDVNVKAAR